MVLESLGAEAPTMDEVRKVLANGHTKVLIIQRSSSDTDEFLIIENPNAESLREISDSLTGFKNFELRSDTVQFGGTKTLALHVIAS